MASLDWKVTGVNGDQIANEITTLRAQSPTFRNLEQMAWDRGYRSAEVTMGPRVLQENVADSNQSSADHSVRQIRIRSDATGTFGIGGRQITVGEVIAHELAHGAIPPEVAQPGKMDFRTDSPEELWARRQTGAVAAELGLRGPNNADFPITRVPIDREQACTFDNIHGNTPRDGVLFLDGSRGSNGIGSVSPGRSGSIDPDQSPGLDSGSPALGFGNFADAWPNAAPSWPSPGTSDAPPIQSGPAGIAGTAAAPPNEYAAGYPYSVPIPEGLKPVARFFFPEWFEGQEGGSQAKGVFDAPVPPA
jgi:hypothetical protein